MSDLKQKAVNSIIWTTIRTIIVSISGPLLLVVKARYLSPSEFGTLAIINIFISLINVIENFGTSTAIIQKDHVTKNERSSLFIFQLLVCSSIGIIIIFVSPLMSLIFNMKSLEHLLPYLSIMVFLNGPALLFQAFLEKEFHFKELSIIQIIRELSLLLLTTILLMNGLGLFGIILGQVVAVALMVTLILLVAYKNDLMHLKFHFKLSEITYFIKFGVYIAGKQMMTQLTHHVDELIIGYFLSAEALGLYHFAKNMLNKLRTLITTSFAKVLFPLLSKVKNNLNRLGNTYNYISKFIGVFAFPIFVGIALTVNRFIPVFFGNEWLGSANFFIILSIAYIPYILTANLATSLLYSLGKPNVVLSVDVVVNIFYIFILFLFSWLEIDIYFIVALYAVYLIIKTLILQYLVQINLNSSFREYLYLFKNTIIATTIMSTALKVVEYTLLANVRNHITLIIMILLGVIFYIGTYYILDKKTLYEIKKLLKIN